MNENLNLVEILKDCPKGTKLYSPLFGDVEFLEVSSNLAEVYIIRVKYTQRSWFLTSPEVGFTKDGRYDYYSDGECVLFPSKEQRDWSKFTATWYKKEIDTIARIDSNK